ncbi:transmembrane protein 33-like [Orbicella faveolata]|uniref:transmembrane protein 33-like n=1 Tax=Orbicella faveolata TaxID=48498 RepID=UPI0009E33663|nr:transmembrane protein 33-like [Orbicella faveolata]
MPPQENEADSSTPSSSAGSNPPGTSTSPNWSALRQYLMDNKIDSLLWLTRVFTIICSILYLLPFFSPLFSYNCYKRVLISSAATSALRLHQRLPRFQFSREYFGLLLAEDSCHYLLYSIMFVNSQPVTIILIPVALFALLHTVSFTKKLLSILGTGGILNMSLISSARKAIEKVEMNQQGLLRFIACTEIMLMPAVILMMLSGQVGIVIPFVYYRFLGFRYASRRNPYCRLLFSELRQASEQMAGHPRCPGFMRTLVFKFTAFIARLAPPITAPPPQATS